MRIQSQLPPWARHIAAALAMIVGYSLARSVSVVNWMPEVGIRMGLAILVPRRYWPALLVGDVLASTPIAILCLEQLGWVGALLHIFPEVALAMLPVWLLRDYLPWQASGNRIVPRVTSKHMALLLVCCAVASVLIAMDGLTQFILTLDPTDDHSIKALTPRACRYLIGSFVGCLTLAPLMLAVYDAFQQSDSWSMLGRRIARSRLLLQGLVLGVSSLAFLTALGAGVAGDSWREIGRFAMFFPVAWMAMRYGWQGAAVGGTAASVGIMLSMSISKDASAPLLAHGLIAFAVSALLPLGARIGALDEQEKQANEDLHQALHSAKRELYQAELSLRDGVEAMGQVYDALLDAYYRLLRRVRHTLSEDEERRYRLQLISAKHEKHWVANSIHPVQWKEKGIAAALYDGPIAQTLNDADVIYYARVPESANELSPGAQMTLYRIACEAVGRLLDQEPAIKRMNLRVLLSKNAANDAVWAALVVEGEVPPKSITRGSPSVPAPSEYRLSKLGAKGLSLAEMQDRIGFYAGKVRAHRTRRRIVVSLLDTH